ncbi:coagulation factor X-like isoform X2 [Neocloeon triangulifer]|nr:coagulation factor X-like isoform X2 [Neocloeon triangulifer]XP_059486851.1 coagulation factor X-like isoform X2 [Neocloeon triangulifer]
MVKRHIGNEKSAPTPVFRTNQEENLSFGNCGNWFEGQTPPWVVYVVINGKINEGVLLSAQTIVLLGQTKSSDFDNEKEIAIFGGECLNINCFKDRGFLRLVNTEDANFKVIPVASIFFAITIWTVEPKLHLTPNLQPVCLWNRQNQFDSTQQFYYYDSNMTLPNRTVELVNLPGGICPNAGNAECYLYGKASCSSTQTEDSEHFVYHTKGGRSFLRAAVAYGVWIDFTPVIRSIVSASADLAMMPEIPNAKPFKNFGTAESFPHCGFRARIRHRRQNDKSADARNPLITNGQQSVKGQHPWHASLAETKFSKKVNFCGATLLSSKTLVTAAHCVVDDFSNIRSTRRIYIILGMHQSSKKYEETRQIFQASTFVVHPDYVFRGNRNDLALIILDREVQINNYVRPICLWNYNHDLAHIVNYKATVVGWGLNQCHQQPDALQKAEIKIVSYQNCYESSRLFFSENLHPRENFCAGNPENQVGVCLGDSGGGLAFYDYQKDRYFLRGIVSSGRNKSVKNAEGQEVWTCKPNHFNLFTDLTNYLDWILANWV